MLNEQTNERYKETGHWSGQVKDKDSFNKVLESELMNFSDPRLNKTNLEFATYKERFSVSTESGSGIGCVITLIGRAN